MNQHCAPYASIETRACGALDYKFMFRNERALRDARERCTQAALALAIAYDVLRGAEREKSAADAAYRSLLKV